MRWPRRALGWILAVLCGTAAAAQSVKAIDIAGSAVLTKCFSAFLSSSCNTYHHVALPEHVEIGDRIPITYGSNRKDYNFPVRHIRLDGDRCTILGDQQGDPSHIDKLVVAPCRAASSP